VSFVFAPDELTQRDDRSLSVAGWNASVTPLHETLIGNSRQTLTLLFAATCSLLIVA